MSDKAERHPLSDRPPNPPEPDSSTPITPIGNFRLAETIKHGGRVYQLMVESVRDYAIFMLDPAGYIASWNRGAERIKGYTANEIIGRHFSVFYPRADIDAGKPAHELEVAAAVGRFEDEGIRVRKDGTVFWANVIITAVRDTDKSLIGFVKVTRDLTERRAAQQQAIADARRIAESEAANSAKAEFLTAMSHELRTPLNAIGGYTELLSMGLGGPITSEQLDYLERIRKSQQHLMGIISDLLNFSRIEAGHVTYDTAPILLSHIVELVITMVEPQSFAKGVKVRLVAPDSESIALGDRAKVAQILMNVLSNAVKFNSADGDVTISIGVTPATATVSVKDTGCGIPSEKLESIFEPFVQLGRSLSSAHEGTGLGLAISRDLARAMSGDLTVTSALGAGSTFILTLPRAL
jgi:PAS domain S-box-containing protein